MRKQLIYRGRDNKVGEHLGEIQGAFFMHYLQHCSKKCVNTQKIYELISERGEANAENADSERFGYVAL